MRAAAVVVALVTWSHARAKAPAADPGTAPDVKATMERNKRCLSVLSKHGSRVSYDRKDLEKYLAEWPSFDALDIDQAQGDSANGPECVDLPAALANPRYAAWARERGLDPKDWLLKSLRISLTYAKWRAPAQAAEMKAQMEMQRREMEKHCKSMGPGACRDLERAFAGSEDAMREMAAMMALLPDPTRSEAALLAEYDLRLRRAAEGGERRERRRGALHGGDEDAGDAGQDGEDGEK